MIIQIPEHSLLLMIGANCTEKKAFVDRFFKQSELYLPEIIEQTLINKDPQNVSKEVLNKIRDQIFKHQRLSKVSVIDLPDISKSWRRFWINLADSCYSTPISFVFLLPKNECRNRDKSENNDPSSTSINETLRSSLPTMEREFKKTYHFKETKELQKIEEVIPVQLPTNKSQLKGPFDIIGDVHGCLKELYLLLQKLGYQIRKFSKNLNPCLSYSIVHPHGRKAIFLGDFVDRGPNSPEVLRLIMSMVKSNTALCIAGNHDDKLMRKLMGRPVEIRHGLESTVEQFSWESSYFQEKVKHFLLELPSHLLLDEGKLVVTHAGIKEEMQGHDTPLVRAFCLYGKTDTDELEEDWVKTYQGQPAVVYGHAPVLQPKWINNTIDIDTGCVFGGKLTALQYPEQELVSVRAHNIYSYTARPEIFDLLKNEQD